MRKNHLIHADTLQSVALPNPRDIIPVLEKNTLDWARQNNPKAHESTTQLQQQLSESPSSDKLSLYFRYLRRLLQLKLDAQEAAHEKVEGVSPDLPKELSDPLRIESLRCVPFLSCTQIGMYETCQKKYFYRYCLGVKSPKAPSLFFGTCLDEAMNLHFTNKKDGILVPRSAVHAEFYERFDKDYSSVEWGEVDGRRLQKHGPAIIDAYLDRFDAITQPVAVQQEVKIALDRNGLLIGAIDILEKDAIIDTKTAKEKWKDGKHTQELQPKAYSLWFYEQFQRMPKEFKFQIVTKEEENGKPAPQTQLITFEVKKYQIESFKDKVQKIWDEIQEKLKIGKTAFLAEAEKARPSVLCTQEWCEFAGICKSEGLNIPLRWDKGLKRHIFENPSQKGNLFK